MSKESSSSIIDDAAVDAAIAAVNRDKLSSFPPPTLPPLPGQGPAGEKALYWQNINRLKNKAKQLLITSNLSLTDRREEDNSSSSSTRVRRGRNPPCFDQAQLRSIDLVQKSNRTVQKGKLNILMLLPFRFVCSIGSKQIGWLTNVRSATPCLYLEFPPLGRVKLSGVYCNCNFPFLVASYSKKNINSNTAQIEPMQVKGVYSKLLIFVEWKWVGHPNDNPMEQSRDLPKEIQICATGISQNLGTNSQALAADSSSGSGSQALDENGAVVLDGFDEEGMLVLEGEEEEEEIEIKSSQSKKALKQESDKDDSSNDDESQLTLSQQQRQRRSRSAASKKVSYKEKDEWDMDDEEQQKSKKRKRDIDDLTFSDSESEKEEEKHESEEEQQEDAEEEDEEERQKPSKPVKKEVKPKKPKPEKKVSKPPAKKRKRHDALDHSSSERDDDDDDEDYDAFDEGDSSVSKKKKAKQKKQKDKEEEEEEEENSASASTSSRPRRSTVKKVDYAGLEDDGEEDDDE